VSNRYYTHENVTDREFTSCWVVHEIRKAGSIGYNISNIYEIWQYEITQYNPQTKERGHFIEYINTFLKITFLNKKLVVSLPIALKS